MHVAIYVNYAGNCEAAFRFYEQLFGGRVTTLSRHSDMPNPNIPADWNDKVLHARLQLANTTLMGADVPTAQPMRSAYVTLTLDSVAESERIYAALGEHGEIFMAMAETPFAKRFAMLRDRFGTSWMLLHGTQAD